MSFTTPFSRLGVAFLIALGARLPAYSQSPLPEENRFTKSILTEKLDEPMEMTFLPDKRILFVERKGNLKAYDPKTKEVTVLATIPVNTKYTNRQGQVREAEEGLMGLIADPNYAKNNWIYMYYADPTDKKHVLARWELKGDELVEASKKVVLEVTTQREECCHTGGGMVFDKVGNLYLTTGNNTSNSNSDGYANLDERPNQSTWDDQRGAASTNDLRGKILRIKPQIDGTYTIPEGNLFPKGTAKTRPEIYTMGHRNPWRPSIDSKTGYLYWGEVGPDASQDSPRGPRGYDEFNQAKGPGFFGWPYFIGDNKIYSDWDFETNKIKADSKFDPARPINDSPNNTGLRELPPAQKAFVWYPYGNSTEFPLVGSSGRSATGGPVFRKSDFKNAPRPFPDYYEGKWLMVEFMRGWIMAVTMDENGDYKSMERFMPSENFSSAIDMDFSPDGDLYVLEYGSAWFRGNDNARLVKIEYNAGNRTPMVEASADKKAGAVPFKVAFSSEGTQDFDKDALKYEWKITSKAGVFKTLAQPNPTVTFDKPGTYKATLTVTDPKGAKNSRTLEIKAGNEAPEVALEVTKGNKSFFFPNENIEYKVKVNDKEDGSLDNGKIAPGQVAVNIDYMPDSFDPIEIASNYRGTEASARFNTGYKLMSMSDCKSCHIVDKKSVGPSYKDIAQKYKGDASAPEKLAKKIIAGGGGVWGDHAMSAHPQISSNDAATMVKYILSLGEKPLQAKSLPTDGSFTTKIPENENGKGSYVLRAAYTDRGTKLLSPLMTENILHLRNPSLDPAKADKSKGTQLLITPSKSFNIIGNDSYIAYNQLDLTGIKQIEILAQAATRVGAAGGTVEVRLGSPTGKLIGETNAVVVREQTFGPPPAAATNNQNAATPPAQAAPRRANQAQQAVAKIEATQGFHDVYFVFKNPKAQPNQILMSVSAVQFQNTVPNL
ncbi:PQQ-dependent sugar dehydrogenase [Runella sp.]|uniref:PQQ-dependent sugar dehydrogenase n=1 Tax=Runella sp. TaxID=1960881 RepID=UPI003D12B45F